MSRFEVAIARIDAANADDPNRIIVDGSPAPKELAHAAMLSEWVLRLRANATETLLLAARAHHIRRWEIPRASYADGRSGYLRWRTQLYNFHAEQAGRILRDSGYSEQDAHRVEQLVAKRVPRTDADAQALEDGLCLVFLQTQFAGLSERVPDAKMVDVLRKTWRKMSPAGREAAAALELPPEQRALLDEALSTTP